LIPFGTANSDFFKVFAVLGTSKITENFEFLTGMLRHWASIRLRNWCAPWACASGTDAHHTHQMLKRMLSMRISFPTFHMFILCTLSMRVRDCCMHCACASGTDAYAEHTCQELLRVLSIRVRYWCVHSAQSLQNMLSNSIHIINLCVCWAYGSGTDPSEHMHQDWCAPWGYASVSFT
jgi:hypothetical protein